MAILIGAETITHRRFAAGSRGTDGRHTPGASVDTSISASVQVLSGREVDTLEEGERSKDWRKIYVDDSVALRPVDQHASPPEVADQVVVDSIVYEVRRVDDWRASSPIPHRRAFVRRLKEPL
jgi:hypothetical protein